MKPVSRMGRPPVVYPAILAAIKARHGNGGATMAQIFAAVGGSRRSVTVTVCRMARYGRINHNGKMRYRKYVVSARAARGYEPPAPREPKPPKLAKVKPPKPIKPVPPMVKPAVQKPMAHSKHKGRKGWGPDDPIHYPPVYRHVVGLSTPDPIRTTTFSMY